MPSKAFNLVGHLMNDTGGAGAEVELLETDGRHAVLLSPAPAPTGSTLELGLPGAERPVLLKVRSCRRDGTGPTPRFRVEGRFVNLDRAQRQRLISAADRGEPGPG